MKFLMMKIILYMKYLFLKFQNNYIINQINYLEKHPDKIKQEVKVNLVIASILFHSVYRIKEINNVEKVVSIADVIGTEIPKEMLPKEVQDMLYDENKTLMLVTFKEQISSDETVVPSAYGCTGHDIVNTFVDGDVLS